MREMKDSGIEWVGAIPQDWQLSKIGSLYTQRNEKVSDKDYQPLSVTMQGILPQLATAAKTDDGDNRKLVRAGDFAINSRSDRRGSCGISPLDGSVSLINIILTPRTAMHPGYYNWLFRTTLFADEFYKWGHGIVADLWTTRWQEMKSITVPVPEYAEQERIAAFLDAECAEIDTVLEKTRASIEEYKKLKQAVITQAVTKGVRGDRPMKNSGIEWIGDIPAEWEIKRIKNICSLKTGSTPSTGNAEWFNGDLLWFTPGDFNEKFALISSNRTLSRTAEKDGVATMIPANSVLVVCIGGSAGKVGYTNYGCSCNQQITALCKSNIMPKLLMYDVNAGMPFLRNTTMFTTLPILNNQAIGELVLPIPREEEQLSIIEYLDEKCAGIDALIAKKQQYLTEIESYKKSLIYEYVTGKKEVKTSVLAD